METLFIKNRWGFCSSCLISPQRRSWSPGEDFTERRAGQNCPRTLPNTKFHFVSHCLSSGQPRCRMRSRHERMKMTRNMCLNKFWIWFRDERNTSDSLLFSQIKWFRGCKVRGKAGTEKSQCWADLNLIKWMFSSLEGEKDDIFWCKTPECFLQQPTLRWFDLI